MSRPTRPDVPSDRVPPGTRIACVVSSYHRDITEGMARSAADTLVEAGLAPERWHRIDAPGAFELPLIAKRLAERPDMDAVLGFGLVLRGETDHDRYISAAVAQGFIDVGLATDTPVLFGLLTCNTLEQAQARARRAAEGGLDKGREVALAAIGALHALRQASGPLVPAPEVTR